MQRLTTPGDQDNVVSACGGEARYSQTDPARRSGDEGDRHAQLAEAIVVGSS
ncbi:MAG: hypothetical protein M3306_21530 [Actinomycetota bacterium]|nr:hypothetical protein [Actinomycetota bacterium]